MSTRWEGSSFKPHGGHTCEQRRSSARRTRASPRRRASSSSHILSRSSVSAETGTASRVSLSLSRSTNRCGSTPDATSRSQAMRPGRPRPPRRAEAGRAPEIAARLVRRVGLGAEAVEARTLFDCHIWPECRGKLALGSRDRREKEGRRCFLSWRVARSSGSTKRTATASSALTKTAGIYSSIAAASSATGAPGHCPKGHASASSHAKEAWVQRPSTFCPCR